MRVNITVFPGGAGAARDPLVRLNLAVDIVDIISIFFLELRLNMGLPVSLYRWQVVISRRAGVTIGLWQKGVKFRGTSVCTRGGALSKI